MLTILRKIVESVSSADSLSVSMLNLVIRTKEALGVDCCSIYVNDRINSQLTLVATDGLDQKAIGNISLTYDEGLVGLVARKLELVNLANATEHHCFKYIPEIGEEKYHSFMGVPVVEHGDLLGVLVIQQQAQRKFDEMDESFMVMLAAQLAGKFYQENLIKELGLYGKKNIKIIRGKPVSKGIAKATTVLIKPPLSIDVVEIKTSDDPSIQYELFLQAMQQVQFELDRVLIKLSQSSTEESSKIFEVYSEFLNSPSFTEDIEQEILTNKLFATSAVKIVCERYIEKFMAMGDEYQKERATDIKDIAHRLLAKLAHGQFEYFDFSKPLILVAEEVSASLIVEIPRTSLKGVISQKGTVNSHAAILARNLGVPTVMGFTESIDNIDNKFVVIDGNKGAIIVDPDNAIIEEYDQLINSENKLRELAEQEICGPTITLDGQKVNIELNAGLNVEYEGKYSFVDGVGLYRTEIPFMLKDKVLSEKEQLTNYRDFLTSYKGLPVCMRTLDIGGDKSLSCLKVQEDNPALGWRGVRLTLDNIPIFVSQLKAMLKANIGLNNLSIMIPMVSSLREIRESKKLLDMAYSEVKEELGLTDEQICYPKFGAMIEIPSAVLILEELSKEVDFFSIGTNDLIQYLLAVDRNNTRISNCYRTFHPAVLKCLNYIYCKCGEFNKPVSICGEFAGDVFGILLLLVMGYRTFSMNMSNIAKIKYILRRVDLTEIQKIVEKHEIFDFESVKPDLENYLRQQNLYDFIHDENAK